jgi:hypothetical protein
MGLVQAGRILFAIALLFFGIEFFIYASGTSGPLPGPPWARGGTVAAWLIWAGFVAAALSITSGKLGRWTSMVLGICLLLFGLIHYGPVLVARLHDPGPWTVLFELLALGGGSFIIAASFPPLHDGAWRTVAAVGRYLVAVSLVVFAVQHFMYARFVADLVPAWIPTRLFWAYFTGIAFVAAALAIAANKMVRIAATLLGTMFFLWVVLLHVPRVAGALRNGDEVTSLFVALAMSGVSFVLAGVYGNSIERRGA